MSLGGGGLLGTVEPGVVLLGLVLLPGTQGFATVAEVPLGRDGDAEAVVVVVEELPVEGVLPVEDVLPAVVEVPVPLLAGVHGATVVDVPVWLLPCVPPVTEPALPATPGVPCVTAGLPVVLAPGWEVCTVPIEPDVVEVVPVWVDVVPGWVLVVPVLVDDVPGEVEGLGVAVPVDCAVAMPTDNANTDVASKNFRIENSPC